MRWLPLRTRGGPAPLATPYLPWYAHAGALHDALAQLPGLNVTGVTRAPAFGADAVDSATASLSGFVWTVTLAAGTFDGDAFDIDSSLLSGTNISATVSRVAAGIAGLRGSFTLALRSQTSALLAVGAPADAVRNALQALPGVGTVAVSREQLFPGAAQGYAYYATFSERLALGASCSACRC